MTMNISFYFNLIFLRIWKCNEFSEAKFKFLVRFSFVQYHLSFFQNSNWAGKFA